MQWLRSYDTLNRWHLSIRETKIIYYNLPDTKAWAIRSSGLHLDTQTFKHMIELSPPQYSSHAIVDEYYTLFQ